MVVTTQSFWPAIFLILPLRPIISSRSRLASSDSGGIDDVL